MWMLFMLLMIPGSDIGLEGCLADWWLDGHPGATVLDYPWGDENGCSALVVSESKEGINEVVFEWHSCHSAILSLEGVA